MKRRHIIITLLCVLLSVPAIAVFNEKNLAQTLSVLRFELQRDYRTLSDAQIRIKNQNLIQHGRMVEMMKDCNELALVLYSQEQNLSLEMTYALDVVTKQYMEFTKAKMPYDAIVDRMNTQVERYERLIESLRRLPPALETIDEVPDSISISKDSLIMMMSTVKHDLEEHEEHEHLHYETAEEALAHHHEPYMLDEAGQIDRDSCLFYALNLLRMYTSARNDLVADSEHYTEMANHLKDTYDYASAKYAEIQKNIFITGQDNFFKVVSNLSNYIRKAQRDLKKRYSREYSLDGINSIFVESEWRGGAVIGSFFIVMLYLFLASILGTVIILILSKFIPRFETPEFRQKSPAYIYLASIILFSLVLGIYYFNGEQHFILLAAKLLLTFAWLVFVILLSLIIRLDHTKIRAGLASYNPMIMLGLIVIVFRAIFVPNSLLNLIYPPILISFFVWQLMLCKHIKSVLPQSDKLFAWISLIVIGICTVMAVLGYNMMSLQVCIWWLFQLACIQTINAIYDLMCIYEKRVVHKRISEYKANHVLWVGDHEPGAYIVKTWFFDFFKMTILPALALLTIPYSLYLASDVFDLTSVWKEYLYAPFFDLKNSEGEIYLHLSLFKILVVVQLYFFFRYLSYVLKSVYRHIKYNKVAQERGNVLVNQVNLTLANNIVEIVIWGLFLVICVLLLKIPMGAISLIAAGLATGLGLAMKDVLNNFVYGIQLMSGRLRVGDYVECDGVRGRVERISYQTTDIKTVDSAIMAFTNTSLFNKNFTNLTKNDSYEVVRLRFGVAYGTDIAKVRQIVLEALEQLRTKDKYGRDVVNPHKGVEMKLEDFGDSSLNLYVKQSVLVSQRNEYLTKAREIIYQTLNENGVTIPFPQRDIHLIKD